METYRFRIGAFVLEVSPTRVVLASLRRRDHGLHVTWFFEPLDGKSWTIHFTRPGKRRNDEDWFPPIPIAAVSDFFQQLTRELVALWIETMVRSSPEELEDAGWALAVPEDAAMLQLVRERVDPKGRYRLDAQLLRRLDTLTLDSLDTPLRLHELVHLQRPLYLMRVLPDGTVENCMVYFYGFDLPDGRQAGWFALPTTWLQPELIVKRMVQRAGNDLREALLKLSVTLGLGKAEKIEEVFRKLASWKPAPRTA